MQVFVTGATGHIGSAVVPELIGAGHQVVGLARSDRSAGALTAMGAQVHRGTLEDLDSLYAGAAAADGVIHLAFNHDFSDSDGGMEAGGKLDLLAVETLGRALEGTGKPLVITSGTLLLTLMAPGRIGTEDVAPEPDSTTPRVASESAAMSLADRGVRTSVVRLAPLVHSPLDDHGFIDALIGIARERKVSGIVGDGANRWPGVHTLDAAHLFRLGLEAAPAGSRWHAAGEEGVPFREIAEVIGRHLGLPVTSVAPEDADEHFGFLGPLVQLDNPTSSTQTRRRLHWHPEHPGLIPDLDAGHYFTH